MKFLDNSFAIFNGIVPIFVVVFILMTHGNYVKQDEYQQINKQIFERLDNVEMLIHKILNEKSKTSNLTNFTSTNS
jgi:hypothetical protein